MHNFSEIYNRDNLINYLKKILPFEEISENVKISNKNLFKTISKIGVIKFEEALPVYEVKHSSRNDPRIELTNRFYSIISSFSLSKALVIFFCEDSDKYRLSLIESELKWTSNDKVKREFSHPKRLSYLLGIDAKIHTPYNQLKKKIINYKDLKSRFNKEVVTDEFFTNYKNLLLKLIENLENDKSFKNFSKKIDLNISFFSKKLLGQIVFCYFLQKKAWLGAKKNTPIDNGDQNFLRNKFNEISKTNDNFFNNFLEPLFYLGLNCENPNSFCESINCKIPYLNGGLFEPIENYDWENENLNIPNSFFSNNKNEGILDIFDLYNFTVDEHEDLDIDIAIDPEMLGHVFEKLLDVDTREEQGTYYTPKEIVVYMCRRSLIDYLHKNLNIDKSFDLNDLFLEKFDFTIFKNYLSQIDELLKEVSICDPCVGSGAFPVTMMNEVSKLRYKLLEKKDNKEKQIYSFKKFFIQNNIYGVDIEPGAVEIAKLRLWLSLIVDVKDIKQIEALPNLDYKIMQGDSLIDEYYGINFENNENDLFGMDPELEKITKELQTKQNEYFNLKYLKSKVSKRKEVQVLLKKVLQYALDQQKSKLNFKKNTDLIKTVKNIEKNINELTKTYSIKEFFFWRLFFSNIFEKKNGFDIVIANPPYVFTKYVAWNKDYKKFLIEKYLNFNEKLSSGRIQTNKINLYVIFLILGLRLINDKGVNCFVVPNTILRSVIHHNFRHYLLKNSDILEIVDLKPKAFPGVTTSPIIILNNKQSLNSNSIKIIDTNFSEYKQITLDKTHNILQNNLKKNPFYVFNIFSNNEHLKVIKKIREDKIPLKNISKHIIAGIDASDKLIQNGKKNNQYRKLIRGSDVKKYRIEYNNEFILYDRDKMNRARPDELWRASKKIFIQRITGGNNPLVCSIDTNKLLGFASTNILLIHKEYENNYSYEFLSAILNSKLINYFYSVTFSNFSKLTVNISTSYLEEIPIPKINSRTSPIIKNIELTYKKEIKEKKNYNSKLIDKLIYDLYEIKKDDLKTINKQDE